VDRKTWKAACIGAGGWAILGALGLTWRVRVVGAQHLEECRKSGGLIYALWHGCLLPLVYIKRRQRIVVLVSQGRDGEYVTRIIHRFGFETVRGSSTRGGFRSLVELVRLGRTGRELAFTPDGPRGPRGRVQPGLLITAQRTGLPILPLAAAARPCKRLSSWDRFAVPLPFARTVLAYGPPVRIPPGENLEAMIGRWTPPVEAAIEATTARAEEEAQRWAEGIRPRMQE